VFRGKVVRSIRIEADQFGFQPKVLAKADRLASLV
jgi:hypothetical protein